MQEENFDKENENENDEEEMDMDIDDDMYGDEDEYEYEEDEDGMEAEIYTLTDEEGKESDFELIGRHDADGQSYVALAPVDGDEDDEDGFVVLKVSEENGEEIFVTIDDDEEFDRIADMFEDELFVDTDYDEGEDSDE